jgi:hypothetical protein
LPCELICLRGKCGLLGLLLANLRCGLLRLGADPRLLQTNLLRRLRSKCLLLSLLRRELLTGDPSNALIGRANRLLGPAKPLQTSNLLIRLHLGALANGLLLQIPASHPGLPRHHADVGTRPTLTSHESCLLRHVLAGRVV